MPTLRPHSREYHVLVTGFGPFRSTNNNPSWLAAKVLNGKTLTLADGAKVHITALEVQVTYAAVLYLAPGFHARPPVIPPHPDLPPAPEDGYDFVFHVGLGRSGSIAIEKLAHKTGYDHADVDNKFAPIITVGDNGMPLRGFASGYERFGKEEVNTLDVEALVEYLQQTDKNVRLSTDPGRYLCDFIYYCSLAESQRLPAAVSPKRSDVLFMHVPAAGEPHTVEDMTETIRKVVGWVLTHRKSS